MKRRNVISVLAALSLAMICLFAAACSTTKFEVSFDSVGGSAVQSQEVEKGGFAEEPTAPSKSGYSFAGWTLNGEDFVFATTAIENDVTLKAKWNANTDTKYYVTVKEDGEDETAAYATAFGLTESGGKYYLTGTTDTQADISELAEEKAKTGYHVDASSVLTGNIAGDGTLSLTVEYLLNKYTVVFENGGGSGTMDDQEFAYGEETALYTNEFTKEYYNFTGWKCGDQVYEDGAIISSLTDVHGEEFVFVAQWKKIDVSIAKDSNSAKSATDWIGSNNDAAHLAAGKTGSGAQYTFTVFDELDKTSEKVVISMIVYSEIMHGDDWAFYTDYEIWFYALGGQEVIASFPYGYVGDNGTALTNRENARLTLSPEATQLVKKAGGLEIRLMMPRHNFATWAIEKLQISEFELNRYMPPEVPSFENDLSNTGSYRYSIAGDQPSYYNYEEVSAEAGTSVFSISGSRTSDKTFFQLQMDMFAGIYGADAVSLHIYFYNADDTLFDWNAGTYTDYAIEVYAFSESGEYTAPLFTFGAAQYKIIPWRWVDLLIPAEQAQQIAAAGGLAVRVRMPESLENKSYQLFIDSVSVVLGENESVSIETDEENYRKDIEAEVAKRFDGFCAAWVNEITVEEDAYVAKVELSKDGYLNRVITIRYLKTA